MKLVIGGLAGTGKSSLGRALAEHFGAPFYSGGSFFRALARERGIEPAELEREAERDPGIDEETLRRIGEFGRSTPDFVVEGHLVWYPLRAVSGVVRIKLLCADAVRFARVASRENLSLEEAARQTKEREATLVERFAVRMAIPEWDDNRHYCYVIDTSEASLESVVALALALLHVHC